MTVYECQLFTWPYIVKNNADIELLWPKVCWAVLKKLSRVPGLEISARWSRPAPPAWLHPWKTSLQIYIES